MESSRAASFQHHFYPRSPCGERRRGTTAKLLSRCISIHALLAESDAEKLRWTARPARFLSTLSLRRATWRDGKRREYTPISIHALLAESDRGRQPALSQSSAFLSTLSLRRATCPKSAPCEAPTKISIHALLAESDRRGAVPVILII